MSNDTVLGTCSNCGGRVTIPLSAKQAKRQKEALEAVRAKMKEAFASRQTSAPSRPPRYDEVFRQGQEWLDQLAGSPIEAQSGELSFDDGVWKSPARTEPDAP